MGLTNEHVRPKILAKIKIYILTRPELLFTLCSEIPCISFIIQKLKSRRLVCLSCLLDQFGLVKIVQKDRAFTIFCLFLVMFPDQSLTQESIRQAVCSDITFSFIYLAHPRSVTGISWRKTSKYMPRGAVANMLVTSCSGKHQKRFFVLETCFQKIYTVKNYEFYEIN